MRKLSNRIVEIAALVCMVACSTDHNKSDFAATGIDPAPNRLIREKGTYLYNPLEDLL